VSDLNQIKEKIRRFFTGRYGLDELGKALIGISLILYVIGRFCGNSIIQYLSLIAFIVFFYRFMSRQKYERGEENCKYTRYIRSWKLKYEYRKTAKIYMCSKCGKMNRVPKGRGKVQITCPNCGHSIIRFT
jgi:DNA-directed RNA polymerase subunit RPC12/RpoP